MNHRPGRENARTSTVWTGTPLDDEDLFPALGVAGQRAVGEALSVRLVDHVDDAGRRDDAQWPEAGVQRRVCALARDRNELSTEKPAARCIPKPSTNEAARENTVSSPTSARSTRVTASFGCPEGSRVAPTSA